MFRRNILLISLAFLFLTGAAQAAKDVHFKDSALVMKSKASLEKALLSYGDWCDSGCRYKSPGVKVDKRLKFRDTPQRFYTWTWVSDIKDLKYFSEVTVTKNARSLKITKRALGDKDKALIKELKTVSGYPHKPLLDSSVNVVTVDALAAESGHKCRVTMDTKVRVGGFLSMFSGRVLSGLKDSTNAILKALRK